jgi:RimJ/RimL family protein N-acetyltransferase
MAEISKAKRINLRHKRISDAREDYSWQTDPELSELDAASPLNMSYQQFLSEFNFDLTYPSSSRHEFAIDNLEGEHVGNCVYYNVNQVESKAEIGIMIGNRNYWNKGYGTEAVNALLEYIFTRTRLERVYLTTLDWNIRAQKCFKKCGFKETGRLDRDGHHFLVMAIHREEWKKLHAQDLFQGAPLK